VSVASVVFVVSSSVSLVDSVVSSVVVSFVGGVGGWSSGLVGSVGVDGSLQDVEKGDGVSVVDEVVDE
jgi:hypothetical protein